MVPGGTAVVVFMVVAFFVQTPVVSQGSLRPRKCWSKTASKYMNSRCKQACDAGNKCPIYCTCINADSDGDMCTPPSNERLIMLETMMPGSVLFTIPVTGHESWEFSLGQTAEVHGPTLTGLSSYLELSKKGNSYEMVVKKVPDLEQIAKDYHIKLSSLSLVLRCVRQGMSDQSFDVFVEVKQVNEFAPEFQSTPIYRLIKENTPVNSEVLCLSHYAVDKDVNTETTELARFGLWNYKLDLKHDGKEYFRMPNLQNGSLFLIKPLDYEQLRADDQLLFFLNVSASDVHGRTAWTTLTFEVGDTDDLPPEFYHPGCQRGIIKARPCLVSYVAKVDLNFVGVVTEIKPKKISARDMDNIGNTIEFSLENAPGQDAEDIKMFELDGQTGELRVVSPFSTRGIIDLVVVATENSSLHRTTQAPLKILVGEGTTEAPLETGKIEQVEHTERSESPTVVTDNEEDNTLFIIMALGFGSLLLLAIAVCLIALVKYKSSDNRRSVTPSPSFPTGNINTNPTSYHVSRHEDDLQALSTADNHLAPDSPSTLMEMRSSADMTSDRIDLLTREAESWQTPDYRSSQLHNGYVETLTRRPMKATEQVNGAENVDILVVSRPPTDGCGYQCYDDVDDVKRSNSSLESLTGKSIYVDNKDTYSEELDLDLVDVPELGLRDLGLTEDADILVVSKPTDADADIKRSSSSCESREGKNTYLDNKDVYSDKLGLDKDEEMTNVPELGLRYLRLAENVNILVVSTPPTETDADIERSGSSLESHGDKNTYIDNRDVYSDELGSDQDEETTNVPELVVPEIGLASTTVSLSDFRREVANPTPDSRIEIYSNLNEDLPRRNEEGTCAIPDLESDKKDILYSSKHNMCDMDTIYGGTEHACGDHSAKFSKQMSCSGEDEICLSQEESSHDSDVMAQTSVSGVSSVKEEVQRRLSWGRLEQINFDCKSPTVENGKPASIRSYNLLRDVGPQGYSNLGYRTEDIPFRRTRSCRTGRESIKRHFHEAKRPVTSYAELYSRNRHGGELSRQFPAFDYDIYRTSTEHRCPSEGHYSSPGGYITGDRQRLYQGTSDHKLDNMSDSKGLGARGLVPGFSATAFEESHSKPVPIDKWHRQPYMLLNYRRQLQRQKQQEQQQGQDEQQQPNEQRNSNQDNSSSNNEKPQEPR